MKVIYISQMLSTELNLKIIPENLKYSFKNNNCMDYLVFIRTGKVISKNVCPIHNCIHMHTHINLFLTLF